MAALQAAWSRDRPHGARTGRAPRRPSSARLDAAVRAGDDTDTVAAIAGGLLRAAYGASAVPLEWRVLLHGWPWLRAHDLVDLAAAIARGGKPDSFDFSYFDSPSRPWRSTRMTTKCCSGRWGAARPAGRGRRGGLAVQAGRRGYATTCRTSRSGSSTGLRPTRTRTWTRADRCGSRPSNDDSAKRAAPCCCCCVAPTVADGRRALRSPTTGHQHRQALRDVQSVLPAPIRTRRSGRR